MENSQAALLMLAFLLFLKVIGPGYENRVTLDTSTGSVELRSVNHKDAGMYVFDGITIVSGIRESFKGNITLNVSALVLKPVTDPVISKDGDNVTLEIRPPGALTAMTWTFSPTGITVVSWSRSAPVIGTGYVNRVTLNTTTGSLGLSSVNGSDSGVYLFRGKTAVSGNPEDIDGNVTLEVYEPITNVKVEPNPAQPIANQTLKLACQVLGSQIVSSRFWLKDGQPLVPTDRITVSVNSSVVSLNKVLQSDNGEYQCKANGPVNEVTSAVYKLEVNYGPEQASLTGPDKAALNSSVTFTCSAQSVPACIYIWYVNGIQTAQGSQYQIDAVSNVDTGSYMCMAWNSVTRRTSIAEKKLVLFSVTGKEGPILSAGEITGVVIGTLAGVTGIALGVYFSVKLCRKNPDDPKLGPAERSLDAVTWPNASETYENIATDQTASKAKKQDHAYTDLQSPDQSTYSTLNE
ncbi:carcinoembryonic antigen-related cell adhesion molecule 20-like [Acipenser ruthenus]|uniref:carcinoembryonic antigen-related cell adhesion molecule 20-like n=1 Tax=Acipenser ruthenus TaxID=7906 RepID=UPI002741757B|nr:carcinoembryonic antigen-related cell adhesion molecule 20-like [Acipenser ruthenus]